MAAQLVRAPLNLKPELVQLKESVASEELSQEAAKELGYTRLRKKVAGDKNKINDLSNVSRVITLAGVQPFTSASVEKYRSAIKVREFVLSNKLLITIVLSTIVCVIFWGLAISGIVDLSFWSVLLGMGITIWILGSTACLILLTTERECVLELPKLLLCNFDKYRWDIPTSVLEIALQLKKECPSDKILIHYVGVREEPAVSFLTLLSGQGQPYYLEAWNKNGIIPSVPASAKNTV